MHRLSWTVRIQCKADVGVRACSSLPVKYFLTHIAFSATFSLKNISKAFITILGDESRNLRDKQKKIHRLVNAKQ